MAIKKVTYDFEDNTLQDWVDENSAFQTYNSPARGDYSAGAEIESGTKIAYIDPNELDEGEKIETFEFYYQETSDSTGGGIRLKDSSGDVVIGIATDNPQWYIDDSDGLTEVKSSPSSSYDSWYRVKITFDWENDNADVEWEDIDASNTETYNDRPLKTSTDVKSIHLDNFNSGGDGWEDDNAFYMWIDDVSFEYEFAFETITDPATNITDTTATLNGEIGGLE